MQGQQMQQASVAAVTGQVLSQIDAKNEEKGGVMDVADYLPTGKVHIAGGVGETLIGSPHKMEALFRSAFGIFNEGYGWFGSSSWSGFLGPIVEKIMNDIKGKVSEYLSADPFNQFVSTQGTVLSGEGVQSGGSVSAAHGFSPDNTPAHAMPQEQGMAMG